jgi:hypothetical protein
MAFPVLGNERFEFAESETGLQEYEIASDVETRAASTDQPIDKLDKATDAGKKLHAEVLHRLMERLQYSERRMSNFYTRWQTNELRMQAYINHPSKEDQLKQMNETGEVPNAVRIVVPFGFAAASTLVTYLLHTFASRSPLFPLGSYKDEGVKSARRMETLLEQQADHTGMVLKFWQIFTDWCVYGFGAVRTNWTVEEGQRTFRQKVVDDTNWQSEYNPEVAPRIEAIRDVVTVYEGNEAENIDPFGFFPDPRVPMHKVHKNGEFVFWREYMCRLVLLNMQDDGDFRYVDKVTRTLPKNEGDTSNRSLLARGISSPGSGEDPDAYGDIGQPKESEFIQVDQGTVRLIPSKWGLGKGERAEIWQFTILNKDQIVQAEPLDADHDQHPVAVIEPFGLGYGFGAPGPADYFGPLQDLISWLLNSHVQNVRSHLNNTLVIDPSKLVMSDLKQSGPGKRIRLRQSAAGLDVRSIIHQLDMKDVTSNHIGDANVILELGMLILGLNETVMGQQPEGGRRTAAEIRTTSQAAISRLAMFSRVCSAQGISTLTHQWVVNTQQYLSEEFATTILGAEGEELAMYSDEINGVFTYPVHDGSLPTDKMALAEIWEKILSGVAGDEELRMKYDLGQIFEKAAELAGAQDIQQMRLQPSGGQPEMPMDVLPDNVVQQMLQGGSGSMTPIASLGRGGPR